MLNLARLINDVVAMLPVRDERNFSELYVGQVRDYCMNIENSRLVCLGINPTCSNEFGAFHRCYF